MGYRRSRRQFARRPAFDLILLLSLIVSLDARQKFLLFVAMSAVLSLKFAALFLLATSHSSILEKYRRFIGS